MAQFCLTGASSRGRTCLKSVFLFMLVWFVGLFMGSYMQVSQWTHIVSMATYSSSNNNNNNNHNNDTQNKEDLQVFFTVQQLNASAWLMAGSKASTTGHRLTSSTNSSSSSSSSWSLSNTSSSSSSSHPLLADKSLCPFPQLDAFDPKIMKYVRKAPTLNCKGGIASVVDVVGDELKVDPVKVKAKIRGGKIDYCVYRSIKMQANNDYKVSFGLWSAQFTSSTRLPSEVENVQVHCHVGSGPGTVVAQSFLALVRKNEEREKKHVEDYAKHVKEKAPKETLSVLMVGVDGTSKQNFERAMPKTRDFLMKEMGGIEFNKYNKIGLNTFPNVLGLLTGYNDSEVLKMNWTYKIPLDTIDHLFLWDEYQKAGYRTSIILDMVQITAFHYLKKGWLKPKFDFYPRPITIVSEPDKWFRKKGANCMGDTPEVTVLHDYWVKLASAFNNTPSTPYFGYSFMARLTHDDQNKANAGDAHYRNFFHELAKRRVLNNTLLVFFSDHGERFGSIRYTYNGLVEAKTPFVVFVFPPWFEKKYPKAMANFRSNTDRLMTAFDIHATLRDLLHFTGKPRKASPLSRAISLFSEIPANRTCSVAGIPIKFCACVNISRNSVRSPRLVELLVAGLLKHITQLTEKLRTKCQALKFQALMFVLSVQPEYALTEKDMSLYHITLRTTPGGAVYEATVSHRTSNDEVSVKGDVSRLNMYRGQAECIDDVKLRPFCYCSKKS